jgi:hypothetical protein
MAKVAFLGQAETERLYELKQEADEFPLLITAYGSGRVPYVRQGVRGPKTMFFECPHFMYDGSCPFARSAKAFEGGCAQSFSAHVRQGEHGAPVQGAGIASKIRCVRQTEKLWVRRSRRTRRPC